MPDPQIAPRSRLTLALCIVLHLFTHAYGAMLVPLYLLIQKDLRLPGVKYAALLVTVYGVAYNACSYGAGMLADRVNRRDMLGWGLVVNAIGIALMGLTRRYEILIALAVVCGLAGTLFHPAANALVTSHFHRSPGMAIGMLGIGSGLGFFLGPQYAGWRAVHAGWRFASVANWQRPCIELGIAGLLCGILFLLFAREAPGEHHARPMPLPLGKRLRWIVLGIAATLGARDFVGIAALTLTSIYLQRAHGLNAASAGFVVGSMMLIGVVANPIAVWLTPGRRRLPALAATMLVSGAIVCTVPSLSRAWILPVLCTFEACHLGTFAMSDAAILERIPPRLRGRVIGLFLTFAGTAASASPWVMGLWTDGFGAKASQPASYFAPYAVLGLMMLFATLTIPLIAMLGKDDQAPIPPVSEIQPAMMEVIV